MIESSVSDPRLSIRIDLAGGRIGPGKIALLEAIRDTGSISGAARKMKMAYRHAWTLIEEINKVLGQPAVSTEIGGGRGGGATLTRVGAQVVGIYHAIESGAHGAVADEFKAIEKLLRRN
jgi:molybdate transport system regulatory protein